MRDILPLRVHKDSRNAEQRIAKRIKLLASSSKKSNVIVACIGTDRSTGDALGPMTGTLLRSLGLSQEMVRGTICDPIHATNLEGFLREIKEKEDTFVLAVDSSLSSSSNIGRFCVRKGPIFPGSGVGKSLPPVGDAAILGNVNVGGFAEYLVLQSTRLHLVMEMSQIIARAIFLALAPKETLHSLGDVAAHLDRYSLV